VGLPVDWSANTTNKGEHPEVGEALKAADSWDLPLAKMVKFAKIKRQQCRKIALAVIDFCFDFYKIGKDLMNFTTCKNVN
jgi:hypothetical protein